MIVPVEHVIIILSRTREVMLYVEKMRIEYVGLNKIRPYDNNPRLNDTAMVAVENSIKEFGFRVPILVDANGCIVAGHTRYKAAKHLGMKEVPIVRIEDLTDDQIKAFRIADNSTGSVAEWDDDLLAIELDGLDFDMSEFGLDLGSDDDEEEAEARPSDDKYKPLKKMELRAFEHYDYLVFVFDNQFDFMKMAQEFGVQKVDSGYGMKKIGIGRIIKGAKLVEKLGYQDTDIESLEI